MITQRQLTEWRVALARTDVSAELIRPSDFVLLLGVALPALLDQHEYDQVGLMANRAAITEMDQEIETLRAEVERLRALLRDWDAKCKGHCDTEDIAAQVAEVLGHV